MSCPSTMVVLLHEDRTDPSKSILYRHACVVEVPHKIHVSDAGDGLIWEDGTKGAQPPEPRYYVEDNPSGAAMGSRAWHIFDRQSERCVAEVTLDLLPGATGRLEAVALADRLNREAQP